MRTALWCRKHIGKKGAEGMLNEETICSRPKHRLKKGHIFLLTLSWKVDEDIWNGACYGKPMGYKFSSKTLSQLERYVLHNEVLRMTFHWKPCSIFSLFLSLSVPVQKPGAAPRNICCQLRISVCSFEGLSHGPPKLLMTLQLQADLGSKKVFS